MHPEQGQETQARRRPHICVCVCTYKRLPLLQRLLEGVDKQKNDGAFTTSIVVADNDSSRSAEPIVDAFKKSSSIPILYCCEPTQNIALVRNKAVENAGGDYIAFIDDDEFPTDEWLRHLLTACEKLQAAGVLGPVRPHFDEPPPQWIVKGHFCDRPEHPTGTVIDGGKCRTGNVLFRRNILSGVPVPFRPEFGTGGEDVDFFQRMNQRGFTFIWCNEGVVYESVPPGRCKRSYMLKRALLRGRSTLRRKGERWKYLLTSSVAVPVYAVLLPVSIFFGQHVFMRYMIRFCDHAGRLLALFGLNPVTQRPAS
jgi:succinoglycan biosynthesis protein ExoM